MVRLTTIALIERKADISRSLFTRYWRDVHGVMAARIPGFESYTQYHVSPMRALRSVKIEPFEGIAIVTFASTEDRAGLASSDISQFIQRDERNVFRRALLYNLESGASETRLADSRTAHRDGPPWLAAPRPGARATAPATGCSIFVLVPRIPGIEAESIISALGDDGLTELYVHDLVSGDPSAWNKTDIDDGGAGRRFNTLIHSFWTSQAAASAATERAMAAGRDEIPSYKVDDTFVMVERGRPTALGLRGWDALQTIEEAGASNQLEEAVVDAIYRLPKTPIA